MCENTTLITVGKTGEPANEGTWDGPAISANGRYVVFASEATNLVVGRDTNRRSDVFIRDRLTGVTDLVSVANDGGQANGGSGVVAVSGDGRYVAFESGRAISSPTTATARTCSCATCRRRPPPGF